MSIEQQNNTLQKNNMYLRDRTQNQVPQPSMLQLTGQLTIMAHPAQLNPYNQSHYAVPYYVPSGDHLHFPNNPYHHQPVQQHQQNISWKHRQGSQKEKEALAARVEKLEQVLSENIKVINTQTLESFYHLKSDLFSRITAYDQSFHEKTQKLSSLQNIWEEKSEQMLRKQENQMQQEEERLATLRQKLDKDMRKQMQELLEEERTQADQIREQKFEKLSIELEQQKSKRKEEIQILESQIRKLKDEERSAREGLEERIDLRMKEQSKAMAVLIIKVALLQEKNKCVQKQIQLQEKNKCVQKQILKNRVTEKIKLLLESHQKEFENLVDMETPHRDRFLIQANNITLQKQDGKFYQVLLGVVLERAKPFVLHACINNTKGGSIMIGVVDRCTQKKARYSCESGNSVCYQCWGFLYYGNNGKYVFKQTGIELNGGARLRLEVELDKGMATFTVAGRQIRVHSDILCQPHRQFVPYLEMVHKGDSIQWRIE